MLLIFFFSFVSTVEGWLLIIFLKFLVPDMCRQ